MFSIDKAPYKRSWVKEQLYTGHLRLDLGNPLVKGNMVVLKGDKRASGKTMVAEGCIKQFLAENTNNHVILVGLSGNTVKL
jgi:F0F1-type ATP synthase alpha subunit